MDAASRRLFLYVLLLFSPLASVYIFWTGIKLTSAGWRDRGRGCGGWGRGVVPLSFSVSLSLRTCACASPWGRERRRERACQPAGVFALFPFQNHIALPLLPRPPEGFVRCETAAKQAAFEEQNRIKNQFRALDDDEVDFLDGVRASQRKEEEARRRETEERLRVFRERRALDEGGRRLRRGPEEVEGVQSHGEDEDENVQDKHEDWAVSGRKRKRTKGRDGKGLARRKSSAGVAAGVVEEEKQAEKRTDQGKPAAKDPYAAPRKLGLVDYGSGEDSDGDEG